MGKLFQAQTPWLVIQRVGCLDKDTVSAKQGHQLIPLTNPLLHAVVIEGHLLLQQRAAKRLRLMDGLQVASAIQVGQLASIDRVVFVAVACDPTVPTRFADDQFIDGAAQFPCQPVCQRSFFESNFRRGRRTLAIASRKAGIRVSQRSRRTSFPELVTTAISQNAQ